MKLSAITPRLLLTPEVDQRLRHWTDIAAGEFSCLGLADEIGGAFLVSEVFLLKQTCTSAETELDPAAVAALLAELDATGTDVGRVRAWIHSHGNLNVFWSTTDARTIETLATGEWLASLVVNKAGLRLARIDVATPVQVTLDEIPVETVHDDLGLRESCEREFRERVTEVTLPTVVSGGLRPIDQARAVPSHLRDFDWDDLDDLLGPEGRLDVGL